MTPYFKQLNDNPVVTVRNGDIEKAIRFLRKRVQNYKTYALLKERRLNPSRADRKKSKFIRSQRRRKRIERLGPR